MPLVSMKEMLIKAHQEKYAVAQFNINNLEWTLAILEECQALKAPVILGVSSGAAKYMGGFHTVMGMVHGLIKDKGYTIPIAVHLDHGENVEVCKKAIDAGFTSVMIDASHSPLEENIRQTKEVVDYAHAKNPLVSVEAELGKVGGQEDHVVAETFYAVPSECLTLVEATGIDCVAPALGSVHGPYQGEPNLGFKEMEEIHNLTGLPLQKLMSILKTKSNGLRLLVKCLQKTQMSMIHVRLLVQVKKVFEKSFVQSMKSLDASVKAFNELVKTLGISRVFFLSNIC